MKKNKPKHKQIIDAAVRVIAENGYHMSQVAKIAKEAGVADGTIYLYFENKEDILVSVFKEKMGQFIKQTAAAIQKKHTADEKLFTLVDMHLRQLASDRHLAIVTQLELRQTKKDLRRKINNVLIPYVSVIDSIIEEGISEKLFRSDLNIPLVRQMIFGTLDEAVTNWVIQDESYDLVAQAVDIHGLITHGITAKTT
ncbi:MAG TPA: TetR/AcrR family transcriptional regulator [Bacillota bacterium]|nr:TetR/AcrR family transcriptional regulator [Bacillota bacterium]